MHVEEEKKKQRQIEKDARDQKFKDEEKEIDNKLKQDLEELEQASRKEQGKIKAKAA
jgi:hypothetical protein